MATSVPHLKPVQVELLTSCNLCFFNTACTVWVSSAFRHSVPHIPHRSCAPLADATDLHLIFTAHGLTRNARDFDMLATALVDADREHTAVICIDVVGRGESDWLPPFAHSEYGYPLYTAQAAAVLGCFDASSAGRVSWVGTSMGGIIGMALAARSSCPFTTLVINDVGPLVPKAVLKRIGTYLAHRRELAFESLDEVKAHFKDVYAPFGISSEAHWDHLVEHGVVHSTKPPYVLACDPAIDTPIQPPFESDVDMWAMWDAIAVANPSLRVGLIGGSDSDLLLPDIRDRMASSGPGLAAGCVIFDGVGHAPALMTLDQIAAVQAMLFVVPPDDDSSSEASVPTALSPPAEAAVDAGLIRPAVP
ncbi:alpha/beta hydrolase fold protein [Thecamonas trahens ATCC 50062]|uniref:Alpha/beta hydrolase fold protein n=1 Tax=Thecamonas trahens ATCC 50062 TaxID=461836 RepID=A0A0L0DIA3_THETB|nr:alpha/beta hydrolase fold protein [Thecamonas trahens ATCC 50062]KNC52042.1 alpha/beta hydrolase fold protein [Thecamonas trahens ATCC 50062]|eukprot:XP_013762050.1 alpha/beta hydrolase fold protein [Thecamonas trahens ATCC 50062]